MQPEYDPAEAELFRAAIVHLAETMAEEHRLDLRNVMWGMSKACAQVLAISSMMMHHQSGHETDDDYAFTLMGRMALLFEHYKAETQGTMHLRRVEEEEEPDADETTESG